MSFCQSHADLTSSCCYTDRSRYPSPSCSTQCVQPQRLDLLCSSRSPFTRLHTHPSGTAPHNHPTYAPVLFFIPTYPFSFPSVCCSATPASVQPCAQTQIQTHGTAALPPTHSHCGSQHVTPSSKHETAENKPKNKDQDGFAMSSILNEHGGSAQGSQAAATQNGEVKREMKEVRPRRRDEWECEFCGVECFCWRYGW